MRLLSAWSAPVHILGCANGGFPLEKMGCQSKSQRGDHHPRAKKPQLKAPGAPKVDSRTSLQKPETAKYPNPGVTCKKHKEAFWRHMGGNHIRPKKHRPWRTSPKSPPFFSQSFHFQKPFTPKNQIWKSKHPAWKMVEKEIGVIFMTDLC